jgi:hypothetical protein
MGFFVGSKLYARKTSVEILNISVNSTQIKK